MKRREFITLLGGAVIAWPLAARAQQPAMPVVGLLNAGSREGSLHFIAGFHFPAMAATTPIPIVLLTPGDPVVQRFVPSLNRPGCNVTGVSFFNATLGAKRLELLREMVPKATTLAFLVSNATVEDALRDTQAATQALGLRLQN